MIIKKVLMKSLFNRLFSALWKTIVLFGSGFIASIIIGYIVIKSIKVLIILFIGMVCFVFYTFWSDYNISHKKS